MAEREVDLECGTAYLEHHQHPMTGIGLKFTSGEGLQCGVSLSRSEAVRLAEALIEMAGGDPWYAAAPDLLEACMAHLALIDGPDLPSVKPYSEAAERMRAAVAKATGGPPS